MGASEGIRAGYKSVKDAVRGVTDVKPSDYGRVEQAQSAMQENQNWLRTMMESAAQRQAPQMAAPTMMARGDVRDVQAGRLGAAPQMQAAQISPEAVDLTRQAAMGLAPSAATGMLQQGVSQAGQLGMALAGARGGYSPAAVRGAQRQMSASVQDAAAGASQLRAQEMAAARGQFGDLMTRQAELGQQASMFNKTQEGQFALAQADMNLKAQMANQGVDLDILKSNAARGDQFALANLQAQLSTMGMNDAMQLAYVSQILGIDEQALATEMARVGIEQQRHMIDTQSRIALLQSTIKAAGDVGAKAASAPAGGA